MTKLQAPFPYFGGKSTIASEIWSYLGDVKHYIEPFFGSGAVLLNRPYYNSNMVETICDADAYVSNVWRSLQFNPDETAKYCDWPVNHVDLMARKKALLRNESTLLENLINDEKWYDPVMAGYWIWAASCWIGSGLTRPNAKPHISNAGEGINVLGQKPHISNAGEGINVLGQKPHISTAGEGINALGQRPHIIDAGKGVQEPYNTHLYTWFRQLSERLRYVRVVCGDWTRVCSGNWQNKVGICGIYFDPPYGHEANRDPTLYHKDSLDIASEVRKWCIERGSDSMHRIVLSGYFDEHQELLNHGWSYQRFEVQGGYANVGKGQGKENENRSKETLFISPYCLGYKATNFNGISDFLKK